MSALNEPDRLIAPCVTACPAEIDIPRYIGLVERGKFSEAEAVVRESIPLPTACGLICYRPCEPWCRRGIMEAPIAINAIKRAAGDFDLSQVWRNRWAGTVAADSGKRVAVVGSGPAGLTATYYLAKCKGHRVTLIEGMPELGGQLRYGLPEYKVPRDKLRQDIEIICETRVDLRNDAWLRDVDVVAAEFDAVLLAIGQTSSRDLSMEGEGLAGVWRANEFLREVNMDRAMEIGSRVVIFGGNNIAVDSARCALRLGAKDVEVIIPGTKANAGAYDFEFEAAEEEGVVFSEMSSPVRVRPVGSGLEIDMVRLGFNEIDAWGRGDVSPLPKSGYRINADIVMLSTGQQTDMPNGLGLKKTPAGSIQTDSALTVGRAGVFAAGDAVTGPDSIVEAMAQGKKAATGIDLFLGGDGDLSERLAPDSGGEMIIPEHLAEQGKPMVAMPKVSAGRRVKGFEVVEKGYSQDQAVAEARRCIRCDLWRLGAPGVWNSQQS